MYTIPSLLANLFSSFNDCFFFSAVPQMINQLFHRVSKQFLIAWQTNSIILHSNKRQYCWEGGGWVIKSIHVPPTDRVMSRHGEFQYAPIFQDLHVHVEFLIISRADSETIKLLTCFRGSLGHLLIVSLYLHQHQLAFVRIHYWCFNLSSISFTSLRLQGTINKYRHQRGNMPWCAIS